MTTNINKEIKHIVNYSIKHLDHLQSWPGYFERRYLEFCSYLEYLDGVDVKRTLEIGCGNGFNSSLLSVISEHVIATDLPDENNITHTPGLDKARVLTKELKIDNVSFEAVNAEVLPYENDSFDFVFASHVLEHIPDQEAALKEIKRVLKPGGTFLCIVPSSISQWYHLITFFPLLVLRILTFKKNISFYPTKHGHSINFNYELFNWFGFQWKNKVSKHFKVEKWGTTQINPLLPLFGAYLPALSVKAHSITRSFEGKIGNLPFIKNIGINVVFLLKK